eukprot:1185059-Prorocentrum_minimum.AAC.4
MEMAAWKGPAGVLGMGPPLPAGTARRLLDAPDPQLEASWRDRDPLPAHRGLVTAEDWCERHGMSAPEPETAPAAADPSGEESCGAQRAAHSSCGAQPVKQAGGGGGAVGSEPKTVKDVRAFWRGGQKPASRQQAGGGGGLDGSLDGRP